MQQTTVDRLSEKGSAVVRDLASVALPAAMAVAGLGVSSDNADRLIANGQLDNPIADVISSFPSTATNLPQIGVPIPGLVGLAFGVIAVAKIDQLLKPDEELLITTRPEKRANTN